MKKKVGDPAREYGFLRARPILGTTSSFSGMPFTIEIGLPGENEGDEHEHLCCVTYQAALMLIADLLNSLRQITAEFKNDERLVTMVDERMKQLSSCTCQTCRHSVLILAGIVAGEISDEMVAESPDDGETIH